ncbi:MAG: HTH-type transcriptional repressor GlcR [Desulfovibrio sp.]
MLPEQRRSEMAAFIQQNGGVDTETLARQFGISVMTARRDLKLLEEQNILKVTWGGAVPVNFLPHEIPYANKACVMLEAKKAIAAVAAEMVRDESCIALDAGTTTLALAEALRGRTLTVITNDLQIGLILSASPTVSVHIIGGWVDPLSRACNDDTSLDFLANVNVTQAFIGTSVWDAGRGATTSSTAKMHLKRKLMACSSEAVLLADSSKFGNFSPWTIGDLAEFSCVVTDMGLSKTAREAVKETGAALRLASRG